MACVRKRRGKYVVDWRDGAGVRHWKTFDKRTDADEYRDKVGPEARQRVTPTVPATSTVGEYTDHWKRLIAPTVKPRTLARYTEILDLHILPRFGKMRLCDLDRGRIKLLLSDKLNAGLEKRTVRNVQAVLRVLLNAAIEDGLISSNPAAEGAYTQNPQTGAILQLPEISWKVLEPATRIERATCGLRNRCSTN